mmetsp:Transcript_115862/g.216912  ORF Transcript_115862/g.216912 Transcript_115862/m.216912 type:complete len:187 (+) Transcript_115862:968-1528(+)
MCQPYQSSPQAHVCDLVCNAWKTVMPRMSMMSTKIDKVMTAIMMSMTMGSTDIATTMSITMGSTDTATTMSITNTTTMNVTKTVITTTTGTISSTITNTTTIITTTTTTNSIRTSTITTITTTIIITAMVSDINHGWTKSWSTTSEGAVTASMAMKENSPAAAKGQRPNLNQQSPRSPHVPLHSRS